MENIASSSDSMNKDQQPLRNNEVQHEKMDMTKKPGNASPSASISSWAESSGTLHEDQQPLLSDEVEHEILPMPEMADSAPSSGTVASTADSASTSGTVPEREEERSLWREKVEHSLRIAKERLQCETIGFRILKVPEYHRQPPEMFTPQGWRFGLHNLGNADTYAGSEAMKLCVPLLFGLDDVQKWEKFCDYVVPDPTRMLGCYGLLKEDINMEEEEIKQLLAFDALFIAWAIDVFLIPIGEKIIWSEHKILPRDEVHYMLRSNFLLWSVVFFHDLRRMENQIPFELIRRAMEYIKRLKRPSFQFDRLQDRKNGNEEELEMWMRQAVQKNLLMVINAQEMSDLRLSDSHHMLDAAHKVICGKEGLERTCDEVQVSVIKIPSAIQLKHAGVKIEGVAKPLCIMSYDKLTKTFIVPKMRILDGTFAFIRNMVGYEYNMKKRRNMFNDYIFLMLDLIRTDEDMDYLIKCSVIDNRCGSIAFEKWQLLNEGLVAVRSSKEHNAMKKDINRRYDQKLPKLWREFRTLFCSRPWLVVSVIAATVITIATLIQTYTAVIGSDRMIPHYKNP